MSDPAAKERAALRLVEMLTPAAALGIECPRSKFFCCSYAPGTPCHNSRGEVKPTCDERLEAARAELHALLVILGVGG